MNQTLKEFGGIWVAGGTPTSVFRLTPDQLTTLTGGIFSDLALALPNSRR